MTTISALRDTFVKFWDSYPNKKNKQAAYQWWMQNAPDESQFYDILRGLSAHIRCYDWLAVEGALIPTAADWLSASGWLEHPECERRDAIQICQWAKEKYVDYLNSERWQTLREATIHRDHYKCAICESKDDLQVHHRTYITIFTPAEFFDLITLCRKCHERHHEIKSDE
jgi:hypothetical protein